MDIIYGIITGLVFGYVLQRGRVCFNSAFRDLRLFKDNFLFKAIILAVILEMVAFHLMAQFGWIHLNPKPFNLIGNTVGPFILESAWSLPEDVQAEQPTESAKETQHHG